MDQPSTSSGCANTRRSRREFTKSTIEVEKISTAKYSDGFERNDILLRTPPASAYEVFKAYEQTGEIDTIVKRDDDKTYTVWLVPNFNVDRIGKIPPIVRPTVEEVELNGAELGLEMNNAPPSQHSPQNIVNALDVHCLMHIFEWLSLEDLYMLAFVCKLFRSSAVEVLRTKHKDEPFDFDHLKYAEHFERDASLSLFVHCLRIFNPRSVRLPDRHDKDVTFQAMIKYCPNLEAIELRDNSNFDPQIKTALWSLLPTLRKLTITTTDMLYCYADLDWQFEELHVRGARFRDTWILSQLLTRNAKLTELELGGLFEWDQLCTLAQCVPNVEKLTLTDCRISENVDHPQIAGIFQRLTAFLVNVNLWGLFLKLLVGVPLDYLNLENCMIDSASINAICRLTTITNLSIGYGMTDKKLRITRSLSGLRELHIKMYSIMLRTLRTILRKSQAITKLIIDIEQDPELERRVVDDISEIIAARPELHIVISVGQRYGRALLSWLEYADWLILSQPNYDFEENIW